MLQGPQRQQITNVLDGEAVPEAGSWGHSESASKMWVFPLSFTGQTQVGYLEKGKEKKGGGHAGVQQGTTRKTAHAQGLAQEASTDGV